MKGLLFLGQLAVVASECMSTRPDHKKCRIPRKYHRCNKNTDLLACADHCLANFGGICEQIQWMPNTRDCYLSKAIKPEEGDHDCLVAVREPCFFMADGNCFEGLRGLMPKCEMLPAIRSESICRILCRIHLACQGYLWNTVNKSCGLNTKYSPRSMKRRKGDIWVRKLSNCPGARCAILRIGVSGQAEKDNTATSFSACANRLLMNRAVYGAQWNYDHNECWLQHLKSDLGYAYSTRRLTSHLLEVVQSSACNEGPQPDEICFRKENGVAMKGGFRLDIKSEGECVEICKQLVNCEAVSWDTRSSRKKCIFHHFDKPTVSHHDYNTYRHWSCPPTPKPTVPDPDTGHLVVSHFTRREKSTSNKRSIQYALEVLQCAFKCELFFCNSFTLMEGHHLTCITGENLIRQYVRKK